MIAIRKVTLRAEKSALLEVRGKLAVVAAEEKSDGLLLRGSEISGSRRSLVMLDLGGFDKR